MAEARADAALAARYESVTTPRGASSQHGLTPVQAARAFGDNQSESKSNSDIHVKDDEGALVVLKYSMAQNELREMVQALYLALDAHEQRANASKHEATQLKEKHERWKQEVQLEREKARKQVQQYQHDLIWANQQLQQTRMQKTELEAENRRLNTQVEEKDSIIDQLNQQLATFISTQRSGYRSNGGLGNELEQVTADFSRKEREVYNSMDHVRKAATSLQQQSKDMGSQINTLQTQLADVKELYVECRSFFEKDSSPPLLETRLLGSPVHSDTRHLEQENTSLKVENQSLLHRCKLLSDELRDVNVQVTELIEQNESLKKLITRFEQSADDGTETIEFLQESLMKLCDQITSERWHHECELAKAIGSAREKEDQLARDIHQLQQELHDRKNKNEADAVSMMLERLEAERHTQQVHALSNQTKVSHQSPKTLEKPSAISSRVTASGAAASFNLQEQTAMCTDKSTEAVDEIEDDEDNKVAHAAKVQVMPAPPKIQIRPARTTCGNCGEKPFSFMVKCQKCKDPYHARCVKPPSGKRRVSHVFKCSACTLQRPTKVVRREVSAIVAPDVTPILPQRPTAP